jgi:hypothetical protein
VVSGNKNKVLHSFFGVSWPESSLFLTDPILISFFMPLGGRARTEFSPHPLPDEGRPAVLSPSAMSETLIDKLIKEAQTVRVD